MKKYYEPHIELIRMAVDAINQYRPDDYDAFLQQQMVQDAILMRLQVIGENLVRIRHIDEDLFTEIADESWLQLIGLRNIISHGYQVVKPERIWAFITEELDEFSASLSALPKQ
jgi:uncharacterized protein with HEPN domain